MISTILAATARLVAGGTVLWIDKPNPSPHIYIANHSSHLDFILLWSVLPADVRGKTRPVAARDYWDHGVRRYFADNVFHALLIDRGRGAAALLPIAEELPRGTSAAAQAADSTNANSGIHQANHAIEMMVSALDAGSSLILFPEGTRDQSGQMGKFRSGLYYVCSERPSIPVVPVHLANLNRILPKGALLPAPLLSRIVMGPELLLQSGETKEDFLERAHEAVERLN